MTLRPLDNQAWGIRSNCFVCSFRRAVKVGERHRIEARLTARSGDSLHMAAIVLDEANRTCAEAAAEFVALTREQAGAATGDVGPGDAGFVRADC